MEDLNFQILQMQDRINKMQQDNEFRFQQLEKGPAKKSEAAPRQTSHDVAERTSTSPKQAPAIAADAGQKLGAPPRALGTISVNEGGNVVGASINASAATADVTAVPAKEPADEGAKVAALPQTDDPNVLYKQGYDFIMSGDYASAEAAFREHIKRYPADPNTADARYWLGEALYGEEHYADAAKVFLDTHRGYPKARTAAEDLLEARHVACQDGQSRRRMCDLEGGRRGISGCSGIGQDKVTSERQRSGC